MLMTLTPAPYEVDTISTYIEYNDHLAQMIEVSYEQVAIVTDKVCLTPDGWSINPYYFRSRELALSFLRQRFEIEDMNCYYSVENGHGTS